MNSLAYIPASDGAANASLMTVTNVRSGGATTIQVNTVANVPTKFYASYGTPHTFTDPVTGETITVISEATAVDFAGHIDGTNIEIDEIAPGYTDNGNEVGDIIVIRPVTEWDNNLFNVLSVAHNDDGTLKAGAVDNSAAIADGVVTTAKIDDDAVTPAKRSGGYKVGLIAASTLSTTGNKAITGVGFAPKLVRFYVMPSASAGSTVMGHGAMTSSAQHTESASSTSTLASRYSSTSACVSWLTAGISTPTLLASYVSMDADGFTINVDTASGTFDVVYEAFA